MDLTTVRQIYRNREQYLDKTVRIGGWVRSVRDSKTFGFIVVSDGSYFETLQVVYHDTMANFAEVSKLNVGAAIIVEGTLVATPEAKQPFEIQADSVEIEGVPEKVGPTSTAVGAAILNAVMARCVQLTVEAGGTAPVFISANVPGGDEHNKEMLEQYKGHIFYMN